MGSAQLAEEHGHELTPARKAPSMAFSSGFLDRLLKLSPRKQLQKLAEYATKSVHRRPSFNGDEISGGNPSIPFLIEGLLFFKS
jgi:hypothetical protein